MDKDKMLADLNRIYRNLHSLEMQTSDHNVMLMADTYLAIKSLAATLQEPQPNREEEKAEEKHDGEEETA